MVRICDQFISLQGEGKRTGIPSLFIRSFGCNLCCKGFGQKDPADKSTWIEPEYSLTKSPEYGCDSPNSWHKMFEHLFPDYATGKDFLDALLQKYKKEDFSEIVITGGEPLLHQEFWIEFFRALQVEGIHPNNVTFETNGIIKPTIEMVCFIDTASQHGAWNFLFSVSPKLNCVAGVNENISINLETLRYYIYLKEDGTADFQFKFVYNGDERAHTRLVEIYESLKEFGLEKQDIMLMPVGGAKVEQEIKIKTAETCIEEGWRYCERVHVDIWGSKMGV